MKTRILFVLVALGFSFGDLAAAARKDYPQISIVAPGSTKTPVKKDQFVILVVEGLYVSHEKTPIQHEGLVGFVNDRLKATGASYIGLHIREGVKYGDVVRVLDTLSQTEAKNIGVSMTELAAGREP